MRSIVHGFTKCPMAPPTLRRYCAWLMDVAKALRNLSVGVVCVFHELYKGPTTLGISMVDLGRASLVA
jgi:hypothetical protein